MSAPEPPCCPVCGQRMCVGDVPLDMLPAMVALLVQSRLFRRIVTFLAKHPGELMSSDAIAARIYGDDPEGGPDSARNCISVAVTRYRHILEGLGWTIEGSNNPGGGRRLVKLQMGRKAA